MVGVKTDARSVSFEFVIADVIVRARSGLFGLVPDRTCRCKSCVPFRGRRRERVSRARNDLGALMDRRGQHWSGWPGRTIQVRDHRSGSFGLVRHRS